MGQNFSRDHPPPWLLIWVVEEFERKFSRGSPLWVGGLGMVLCRSDTSNCFSNALCPFPGSAVSPPPPWWLMWVVEGYVSKISPGFTPYGSEGVGVLLRRSGASDYFSDDLCPLPGSVASRQILPTSLPTNARVVTTETTTDNTTKTRKGTSCS